MQMTDSEWLTLLLRLRPAAQSLQRGALRLPSILGRLDPTSMERFLVQVIHHFDVEQEGRWWILRGRDHPSASQWAMPHEPHDSFAWDGQLWIPFQSRDEAFDPEQALARLRPQIRPRQSLWIAQHGPLVYVGDHGSAELPIPVDLTAWLSYFASLASHQISGSIFEQAMWVQQWIPQWDASTRTLRFSHYNPVLVPDTVQSVIVLAFEGIWMPTVS